MMALAHAQLLTISKKILESFSVSLALLHVYNVKDLQQLVLIVSRDLFSVEIPANVLMGPLYRQIRQVAKLVLLDVPPAIPQLVILVRMVSFLMLVYVHLIAQLAPTMREYNADNALIIVDLALVPLVVDHALLENIFLLALADLLAQMELL